MTVIDALAPTWRSVAMPPIQLCMLGIVHGCWQLRLPTVVGSKWWYSGDDANTQLYPFSGEDQVKADTNAGTSMRP